MFIKVIAVIKPLDPKAPRSAILFIFTSWDIKHVFLSAYLPRNVLVLTETKLNNKLRPNSTFLEKVTHKIA